ALTQHSRSTPPTHNRTPPFPHGAYATAAGTLHFNAGDTSKVISLQVTGQPTSDPNETFNVVLSNATNGATISDGQGLGTIINDDASGSVTINDVNITEGNSGSQLAYFTVTRTGGTAPFDVNFTTTDGTATVTDADY